MKTLIITLEYPPQVGGIASYVFNVAQHLPANETFVYAPIAPKSSDVDGANPWKAFRNNPYWLWVWPHWLRMLWQVNQIVKQEKIEKVHVHHALPSGYVALLMKKFYHIPFTVFLHGSDLQLAQQNKSKLAKFARVCREASEVVVNSVFFKNHLNSRIPNLKKVIVIYPSPADTFFEQTIDEEKIHSLRAQLGLSGKKVFITASRMVERKGFVLLAQMLPQILQKVPNVVWLAVGDGPEKVKLTKIIENEKLQSVVRIFSSVSQSDLFNLFHVSDLFVLPTHRDVDGVEEAWGGVLVEAAAAGLPVVAGKSGGVGEAVQDGVTGIVTDVSNVELTVANIAGLLLNTERAKQMGAAGKLRAEKEFRWSEQVLKLTAQNP